MQLANILTDEQVAAGFALEESADDFVYLMREKKIEAVFTQHAIASMIRVEADRLLGNKRSPFTAEADALMDLLGGHGCLIAEEEGTAWRTIRGYLEERFGAGRNEPQDYHLDVD